MLDPQHSFTDGFFYGLIIAIGICSTIALSQAFYLATVAILNAGGSADPSIHHQTSRQ